MLDHLRRTLQTPLRDFFHAGMDALLDHVIATLALQVIGELLVTQHIAFQRLVVLRVHYLVEVLAVLADAVIHQVHETVLKIGIRTIVLLHTESGVELVVEVDREWIPVRDQHPLTQVILSRGDDAWILDILLHDPLRTEAIARLHVLQQLGQVVESRDAATSRLGSWLHDPQVVRSLA